MIVYFFMDIRPLVNNVLWNGMLAVIPVMLAYMIARIARPRNKSLPRKSFICLLFLIWLAFLPNTCYLLTEWRHFLENVDGNNLFLRSQYEHLMLVKLTAMGIFYFIYSGFGMMTFALAIRPLARFASKRGIEVKFWACPFFMAMSLGVYLGLILRYNSWDLLAHPSAVWTTIVETGGRPLLMAFIGSFGVFLWMSYLAIDIWFDGLAERLGRAKK